MNLAFFLREISSDVANMKQLTEFASRMQVQLDYEVAAATGSAYVDSFITNSNYPAKVKWEAGNYVLTLAVDPDLVGLYSVELWRASAAGADIAMIGQAVNQSSTGFVTLTMASAEIIAAVTDRLKVKIKLAQVDALHPVDLALTVLASASGLQTPIVESFSANQSSSRRRGRFLGKLYRPAEPKPGDDPDGFLPIDGVTQ